MADEPITPTGLKEVIEQILHPVSTDKPWYVTSDPNHPTNRDPADLAREFAEKAKAEMERLQSEAQQAKDNAARAIEEAELKVKAAVERAEAAEAQVQTMLPPELPTGVPMRRPETDRMLTPAAPVEPIPDHEIDPTPHDPSHSETHDSSEGPVTVGAGADPVDPHKVGDV